MVRVRLMGAAEVAETGRARSKSHAAIQAVSGHEAQEMVAPHTVRHPDPEDSGPYGPAAGHVHEPHPARDWTQTEVALIALSDCLRPLQVPMALVAGMIVIPALAALATREAMLCARDAHEVTAYVLEGWMRAGRRDMVDILAWALLIVPGGIAIAGAVWGARQLLRRRRESEAQISEETMRAYREEQGR